MRILCTKEKCQTLDLGYSLPRVCPSKYKQRNIIIIQIQYSMNWLSKFYIHRYNLMCKANSIICI